MAIFIPQKPCIIYLQICTHVGRERNAFSMEKYYNNTLTSNAIYIYGGPIMVK